MIRIVIVAIVLLALVWIIDILTSRSALHRERLKVIERGGIFDDLKWEEQRKTKRSYNMLRSALIAIGVSIGAIVGSMLEKNDVLSSPAVGYVFSISLFVGIAYVIAHFLTKKDNDN